DEQRREQGDRDGDRERREELPDEATDERDRGEDGDGGERGGGDGAGHLLHRGPDRLATFLAVPQMAFDVLQHHDRVVDDPADRDGERAEGQHVERVVEEVQRDERDDDRERDRDGGHQRRADREQEEEDHQDGHDQTEQALGGEPVDGALDERRLVEDGRDGGAPAERGDQVRDLVLDLVGDADRVAVRRG